MESIQENDEKNHHQAFEFNFNLSVWQPACPHNRYNQRFVSSMLHVGIVLIQVAEFAKNFGFPEEVKHIRKSWRLPLRSTLQCCLSGGNA